MQLFKALYDSPLGPLHIVADEAHIHQLGFQDPGPIENTLAGEPQVITYCKKELNDYFAGKGRVFTIPLAFDDTAFRVRVWTELQNIPYGRTISYHQLAQRLGDVKSIRAAGYANGKNPIAIIVPCHRVVGSNGSLVGYSGELWRKRWLLEHEDRYANGVQTLTF